MQSSRYFQAMFSESFAEKSMSVVELLDLEDIINADILSSVVDFATSRRVEKVSPETISHLLLAADFFQMDALITLLGDRIESDFEQDIVGAFNVLDLWHLCSIHESLKIIVDPLEVFIRNHLESISCESSFLQLDSDSVKKILEWDKLEVSSEKRVFYTIKLWINQDPEHRREHFEKLLYCIRLDPDIDVSCLSLFICPFGR